MLVGGRNCDSARKVRILKKKQAGGGSYKFVWSQGYAHLRSYTRDGSHIVGVHRRIGRTNRKIVITFMHEVLNVIVVLQEPLKGVGQVIKEVGARGNEWDRKPKGWQRSM